MSEHVLASIIITSYNYGRYLRTTIESALGQTYPHTEVIVVDDGSADDSREVIASFGGRVIPVMKENGGQGSSFNAGFAVSRGDVLFFLDSDDAFLPTTVETVLQAFCDKNVVKAHWPLWIMDKHSANTGEIKEPVLPEGDLREAVITTGPMTELTLPSAPTSGNAYRRTFLERVMPMPESDYIISADAYLFGLAPLFGHIKTIEAPQGFWRFHGLNASKRSSFEEKVKNGLADYEKQCRVVSRFCREMGISVNIDYWRANAWWPKIGNVLNEIKTLVPKGETFILADEDAWGTDETIYGRYRIPFLEREGKYWGAPSDDKVAVDELERMRQKYNPSFIAFGWPAFWWLDYYAGLAHHLRSKFNAVLENERLRVFDLKR